MHLRLRKKIQKVLRQVSFSSSSRTQGLISAVCIFSSAFLYISAFPNWNWNFSAWICFLPLYVLWQRHSIWQNFFLSWMVGVLAFSGVLYWLVPTAMAGGIPWIGGAFLLLLLSAYLGLFWGVFGAVGTWVLSASTKKIWMIAPLFWASLWVVLEYLRGHLLTGFPWALLGYSQWQNTRLIQISELTAVYGVSFLCALSSGILFVALKKKNILLSLLVFCFGIAANFFLYPKKFSPASLRVAVLQGNIDQYKKWSPEYVSEILESYGGLAETASSHHPELIVWPETALPGWFPNENWLLHWTIDQVKKSGAVHLLGAASQRDGQSFNSAFLLSPRGEILSSYDKMHLVPFGEFIPLAAILQRWISALNALGGFSSGQSDVPLRLGDVSLSVNICYESIFPELVRRQVRSGGDAIINLTNDGWYLKTAAPQQHWMMNIFRAIENRRSLVRADNTGVSGFILPSGKILEASSVYEKTFLTASVPVEAQQTFYTRYGNIFVGLCTFFVLGTIFWRRKNENV